MAMTAAAGLLKPTKCVKLSAQRAREPYVKLRYSNVQFRLYRPGILTLPCIVYLQLQYASVPSINKYLPNKAMGFSFNTLFSLDRLYEIEQLHPN